MREPIARSSKPYRRQRGLAMVEFTIAVPVLLILLMGVGEFGRAFWQYNALTKRVEHGARYVAGRALDGSTGVVRVTAALQTNARNVVVYGNIMGTGAPRLPGLTPANVTVVDSGTGNITVSIAYPYTPIFGFVPGFFYGPGANTTGRTLTTAVTMRAL